MEGVSRGPKSGTRVPIQRRACLFPDGGKAAQCRGTVVESAGVVDGTVIFREEAKRSRGRWMQFMWWWNVGSFVAF